MTTDDSDMNYSFLKRLRYSSQISDELKDVIRQIWQLDIKKSRADILQKKANIRKQIALGKMLMQAGVDELCLDNPRIILSMLKEGKKQLDANPVLAAKWSEEKDN